MKTATLFFLVVIAAAVGQPQPDAPPAGALPPLVVLTDPAAVVGSELLLPTFVSLPQGRGITHDYDGVWLWRLAIREGDVIVPELISQLPDLPHPQPQ